MSIKEESSCSSQIKQLHFVCSSWVLLLPLIFFFHLQVRGCYVCEGVPIWWSQEGMRAPRIMGMDASASCKAKLASTAECWAPLTTTASSQQEVQKETTPHADLLQLDACWWHWKCMAMCAMRPGFFFNLLLNWVCSCNFVPRVLHGCRPAVPLFA